MIEIEKIKQAALDIFAPFIPNAMVVELITRLEAAEAEITAQNRQLAANDEWIAAACMKIEAAELEFKQCSQLLDDAHRSLEAAEQAAVIEKLRDVLVLAKIQGCKADRDLIVDSALAIPTDSTKVLQEWLDKKLGEPVGYQELFDAIAAGTKSYAGSGISISVKAFTGCIGPLFKKPEKL